MVQLYQECARGEMTMLQRLRAQAAPAGTSRSKRQVVDRDGTDMGDDASGSSSDEDDDSDGDAMDEDEKPAPRPRAPPPAPVVDSDGFELVQTKGKRGMRR
uniref:Uncharacterized protein n=1 Tax=Dunaliella tertiolecta TaxID=3047 RepID=A0A7S3R9Z4_DUNTE|mmetsp:Transcript_7452/g.19876  ORF Transcript_7452/g.19876 Transcript_7452/m.19876 type:complete len:101 (-) Transcript_7452:185-487(-)